MGSVPSQVGLSQATSCSPRKEKQLDLYDCCWPKICGGGQIRGWKENFRFRNRRLSGTTLHRLERALLDLTSQDFKNCHEWEKFQLWLQEVMYEDWWLNQVARDIKRQWRNLTVF
ncbi:hypothetical protein JD844_001059 [Phrynosoma platyrhinos]|uniref:MHC class I antigen n=1 Tax=Phrynosoma platyrhinos TaxID=52577 RepID=A0ABQ7T905_PHRPL|nr:hypothetical protein JD844_001059 [Phrynosoma platyrhinos]